MSVESTVISISGNLKLTLSHCSLLLAIYLQFCLVYFRNGWRGFICCSLPLYCVCFGIEVGLISLYSITAALGIVQKLPKYMNIVFVFLSELC
ncbi:hypothetical protein XELAEV_18032054mg [Xenopus laevis]|uniref:Uncharacterized protein n=1 Tax=Xenopus laevis TaxID=8355 RepID=A0A974CQD7_XENLA|nr:hypothetical protein XELAEV_18032054mg [Xenopus laevis]